MLCLPIAAASDALPWTIDECERPVLPRRFAWNAGAWYGTQLGCTAWLLPLGIVLVSDDVLSGVVALAGFAVCNLWGWKLWYNRAVMSFPVGMQRMLGGVAVVVAVAVLVARVRVPGVFLPYWVIAVTPLLMVRLWLQRPMEQAP